MPRWSFLYPRHTVSPSPWWARAGTALHLLRPQWSWRVGNLPVALRELHWPTGVVPLGVYRDLTGARHVRLRVPTAPATQVQMSEAVRESLLSSGLPVRSSGVVGFDVKSDLFDLGGSLLGTGSPHRGVLDLPLIEAVDAPLPRPGLSLGGVPGRPSGGAPLLLLQADHDLHGHLARWQAEAAAQGWATRLPLSGSGQVLLTFTRAPSTVTLTGVRLESGAWGFTLERDTWEHLHSMSSIQSP